MTGIFTYRNFSLNDVPPLDDRVAVITGGQTGIGKEITAQLLLHGIQKVFVLARSKDKYLTAHKEWRDRKGISLNENDDRVEFIRCDLLDIAASKECADTVKKRTERLHMLICNAGLGVSPKYQRSRQDIESVFATNCVGHQILVTLLLPLLKQTATRENCDARVVITSSSMYSLCRQIDLENLTSPTPPKPALYDGLWRYSRSKLGNILFTKELTRRLLVQAETADPASKRVYVNTFFPGNVVTDQWSSWDEYFGKFLASIWRKIFTYLGQSEEDGAATALYLATSDEIPKKDIRGQYFIPIATPCETSPVAADLKLAYLVWEWIDAKATETLGPNWQDISTENPVVPTSESQAIP